MVFANNDMGVNFITFSKYKRGQIVVLLQDASPILVRGMMGEVEHASHKRMGSNVSRMSFNFSGVRSNENRVVVKFKVDEKRTPTAARQWAGKWRGFSDRLTMTSYNDLKQIRLANKQERFIYNMNGAYALLEESEENDE